MRALFSRMTLIGVGLIGGSLALAAKARGVVEETVGFARPSDALKKARELGVIDQAEPDLAKAVQGSDLVVLAAPVGAFVSLVRELSPSLSPGCLVTDVGSVKGDLVLDLEGLTPAGCSFVGGHPIAGREKSGVEAASAGLFVGARCILTPTGKTDRSALKRLRAFWEGVGSEVIEMDPHLHDRMLAAVSHLPHVLAFALMDTLASSPLGLDGLFGLSAGGLRDFTRIAASSPEMWRDIALLNRGEILAALQAYEDELQRIHRMIAEEDGKRLLALFQRAKSARERLDGPLPPAKPS